jgi:hypothetical protein
MDFEKGVFRAPVKKLRDISVLAKNLLCIAAKNKRWISVKALASLAGKAQFMHLAIPVARFYLRELHDVVSSAASWSGTVRLSKQLKRDLEWWRTVPEKHNGAPIFKPVESSYPSCRKWLFPLAHFFTKCHFPLIYIRTGGVRGGAAPTKKRGVRGA